MMRTETMAELRPSQLTGPRPPPQQVVQIPALVEAIMHLHIKGRDDRGIINGISIMPQDAAGDDPPMQQQRPRRPLARPGSGRHRRIGKSELD